MLVRMPCSAVMLAELLATRCICTQLLLWQGTAWCCGEAAFVHACAAVKLVCCSVSRSLVSESWSRTLASSACAVESLVCEALFSAST